MDALRESLLNAPLVACNDVAAQFLGISMAGWNVIYALGLIAAIALRYRRSVS
jgi:disulfide bond formation protein DsbB